MSRLKKLRGFFSHAFAVEEPGSGLYDLTPREQAIIEKLAGKVMRYGLSVPAIMFLESIRPLNFIASQGLLFFEPIVRGLFDFKEYTEFRVFLERRGSVEAILRAIEAKEADAKKKKDSSPL